MIWRPKRPMKGELIEEPDFHLIPFPVLGSGKLDGFRGLKLDGKALSSSFKPIRNIFTRVTIEEHFPDNIDGELTLATKSTFNKVSSYFTKHEGEPDFVFNAFDCPSEKSFLYRYKEIEDIVKKFNNPRLKLVEHTVLQNVEELLAFETKCLLEGYEGIMIRTPGGPYKSGKATVNEGWLLKIKRFVDSDAEILGFIEEMKNTNEQETNELGLQKRSTKQENKVPANTLGAFKVRDIHTGIEFEIGTGRGLTDPLRKEIWENQDKFKDLLIKYQYQKVGAHEKPRFPSWLGFRGREDIS